MSSYCSSSSSSSSSNNSFPLQKVDLSLVDSSHPPTSFDPLSAVVYRDFISTEQADSISEQLLPLFKRQRYQKGHWDAVITKYRERELEESCLSEELQDVIERVRNQLDVQHIQPIRRHQRQEQQQKQQQQQQQSSDNYDQAAAAAAATTNCNSENDRNIDHPAHPQQTLWLPCHVIDLHKDGELNAHVDSVRFSGEIVSGLSLLSPAIMRLVVDNSSSNGNTDNNSIEATDGKSRIMEESSQGIHTENENEEAYIDLYLPPNSLYVLSGESRFKYSHQLLPSGSCFQNNAIRVQRDHRLSIIFRDTKEAQEAERTQDSTFFVNTL